MKLAGLETLVAGGDGPHRTAVILLHGYAMSAAALAPFGGSLGLAAQFLFPEGPVANLPRGRAWWTVDEGRRKAALHDGPRDLQDERPPGLPAARELLNRYVTACREQLRPQRLVLGGFSQGAMLALDWQLHCPQGADALLLFSASRLNFEAWQTHRAALRQLPVLMTHGRQDTDLALAAGQRLRDFATAAGAAVTWVEFDAGHEIPLQAWRAARKFLRELV